MKQNSKLEFHVPLIIAVALLGAVTIPLLGLPFCQSESQLMSEQILYIKNHGIGLVYNNGFVEIPNLFSLIFSQIIAYLTEDIWVLHAIALISALACAYVTYKFGKFFFSVQAGVMSASIMMAQNVFLAQSGLCLEQMMLNACILGSIYMFFREKYGWCTVLTTAASLIDITGVATSVFVIISYLRVKYKEWSSTKNIMLSIPIMLWFALQVASLLICGKFSMRTPDFDLMNFVDNLYFIFVDQYRFVITAILIVTTVSNLVSKNIQYFVREMAKHGAALMLLLYMANSALGNTPSWNLSAVSLLAILAGCAISTLPISYYSKYMIACAIIASSSLSLLNRHKNNDAYVNYKSAVKVDAKTTQLIEEHVNDGATLMCDPHFKRILEHSELGYSEAVHNLTIEDLNPENTGTGNWAIINAADTSAAAISIKESGSFTKMTTISANGYCNEIYRRR